MPELQAALAGRYAVERELGRGGNAVVYLAQDHKHGRQVALKVLRPELAAGVRGERFLREILIAAQLTHPHILTLIDSGEAAGCLYYVTPYVAGQTLRERLDRERQLPVAEALSITRDVAEALGYAHEQGVVHRDIKPENILLEAGHAVVADFGIARALAAASDDDVTASGIAVGTPRYMSPEQATASQSLDGRSDIYSLGCVLYEMLSGDPPFTGEAGQEILSRHVVEAVVPPRKLRPEIPAAVEAAILVALEKRPADRFATMEEFAEALTTPDEAPALRARRWRARAKAGRWILAGSLLVLLGSLPACRPAARGDSSRPSLAVLPFINVGGDTATSYLAEGMTEELINALAQVEGLNVSGRTSSFRFRNSSAPLNRIGTELGVSWVVEGSLRPSNSELRVSVRLVNVADGYQAWAEQYDGSIGDVVTVQEEIARAVAGALRVKLRSTDEARLGQHATQSPEAYDLYLRGRYLMWNRRSRDGMGKAIEFFERAIAVDSGYAAAYSGLADACILAGAMRLIPPEETRARATAAALRAIALDSQLVEAHVSLGRVRQAAWDWRGAEQSYRRAIQLNPRHPQAHSWYGYYLSFVLAVRGRADEAVRETRLSVDLDPLNAVFNSYHGIVLRSARRYDEAIVYHRRAAELSPELAGARYNMAWAFIYKGMYREALAALDTAVRLEPGQYGDEAVPDSWRGIAPAPVVVAVIRARQGRREEALAILRDIERRSRRTPWAPRAHIYAALGDRERTLEALDHVIEDRNMPFGLGAEQWDVVRSDSRFEQLLQKAGLP